MARYNGGAGSYLWSSSPFLLLLSFRTAFEQVPGFHQGLFCELKNGTAESIMTMYNEIRKIDG